MAALRTPGMEEYMNGSIWRNDFKSSWLSPSVISSSSASWGGWSKGAEDNGALIELLLVFIFVLYETRVSMEE